MDNLEEICAKAHQAYCDEYKKQRGKPYWTNGDYSKLDEPTKDYDRKIVLTVLKAIRFTKLQAENNKMANALRWWISVEPGRCTWAKQALKG